MFAENIEILIYVRLMQPIILPLIPIWIVDGSPVDVVYQIVDVLVILGGKVRSQAGASLAREFGH